MIRRNIEQSIHQLRKQLSWTDRQTTLYHFRTAGGLEADVILERAAGTLAAIEVKASVSIDAGAFAALQALRDRLGKRFRAGIVLYLGDQVLPSGDKLWLVPLPRLWSA